MTLDDLIDQLVDLRDGSDTVNGNTRITTRGNSPTAIEDATCVRIAKGVHGYSVYVGLEREACKQLAHAAALTASRLGEEYVSSRVDGFSGYNPDAVATPTTSSQIESTTMNHFSKPFATVDYVYGTDISTASTQFLINSLNRVNDEIKSLQSVDATSTKLQAMIDDLTTMKAKIVAALDAAK